MTNYMPAVEVAKLVRQTLKETYPGHKFSVRKERSTIYINWTDGPPTQAVKDLTDQYAGEGFDGMQDMRYSRNHGTTIDGVRYEYLTDFVFCRREVSEEVQTALMAELAAAIAEETGKTIDEITADKHWYWPAPQVYFREVEHGPWEQSLYQMMRTLDETRAAKNYPKATEQ